MSLSLALEYQPYYPAERPLFSTFEVFWVYELSMVFSHSATFMMATVFEIAIHPRPEDTCF